MVIGEIKVEVTHLTAAKSVYYGNTTSKKVVSETLFHEQDRREERLIAPCGVIAVIPIERDSTDLQGNKVNSVDVFSISVNRNYLQHEDDDSYTAFFHVDDSVYELYVKFNHSKIEDVWLSEWVSNGYFEDGDEPDNIWKKDDFSSYSEFY